MYKCEIVKMTELDNYKNGCDPATFTDHGVITTLKADNIENLVIKLKMSGWNLKDANVNDESIELCISETAEGDRPTNDEYTSFKHGILDLYTVNYVFYFSEVVETPIFGTTIAGFFK